MNADEVFDHPAFASLKNRAAAFVVVRPATRDLIWANAAAAAFWNCSPEILGAALFGPPGRGWLGTAMNAVVPGRSPQMFRTGLAPGLGMRGAMVLARATAGSDGTPVVGFAVPASGAEGAPSEAWRRGAAKGRDGLDVAPEVSPPEAPSRSDAAAPPAEENQDGEVAGTSLARRGQVAILRDRLGAATDGAATLRFLWRTDARGALTHIDERLPTRLGAPLTAGSEPLSEAVARFDAAAGQRLGDALSACKTWSGVAVRLPVAGGAASVPTLLSGSPVFGRDRSFEGFRGFGIVDLGGLEAKPREAPPGDAVVPEGPPASEEPTSAASVPTPDTGAADAPEASRRADGQAMSDIAEPDPARDEMAPTPYGNVVDLRTFQAGRSVPPAVSETPPPATPLPGRAASEPASPGPDAVPSEDEPLSADTAFLALGAALRAQIGEDTSVGRAHGAAPPDDGRLSAADAGDAHGSGRDETGHPAAAAAAILLGHLPVPVLVMRDGAPVFANPAAARALAFDTPRDLVAVGPRLAMGVTASGLTLRNGRDEAVAVAAAPTPVDWEGSAAVLWTADPGLAATHRFADEEIRVPRPEGDEGSLDMIDLIDRVDDAVAVLDGEGRIRRLNERGRSWFAGDAVGESVTALLAPESRAAALQLLGEARMRDEASAAAPSRREVSVRTADGAATPMLLTLGRLSGASFYATLRDVSALRRAEAQSRGERERDAGRMPDLLARVSHEIRTPLNAILGFTEVMMDERFGSLGSPRYRDYLKDIHASGTQVMALVGDLLDLSRIEAGRLDLDVGAVDVNKIVTEIVAQMQPEANRGRVIVRTSLASRIPAVMADEQSARQIVQHLLSNAVKFNEPGGQVIVSTAQHEDGAVLLRIRDTGVGMTEAEIAAALEPFHDVSPPRPANGNGLGLPLARALVGANGASLSIRSRPREGTLVEVSFPAVPPHEARRPA